MTQPEVTNTVGGAITVFIDFCNMLQTNGYDITGLCYADDNNKPNLLDKECNFVNLKHYYNNKTYSEAINIYLKEHKPDLIIFFFKHLLEQANLDIENNSIPKILTYHSRPDIYTMWDKTLKLDAYNNITLQVLFDSYKTLIPSQLKNKNIITIPNYTKNFETIANLSEEKKKIIYLSRVDCYKGLEFLIKSFKTIAQKHKEWELHVYGQSQPPEYVKELETKVKKLKLDKQFVFKGITKTPIDTIKKYDLCVFPSYFEGFPMGLIETQSVGLPCIGLSGSSGVNELIIDGYNGFLTEENPIVFGKKIEQLICDKNLRITFGNNALENSKIYNKADIDKCWLNAIKSVLDGSLPKSFDKYPQQKINYKLFPISKIEMLACANHKKKWYQYIFSIKNSSNKTHKIITILGLKLKIRKRAKGHA